MPNCPKCNSLCVDGKARDNCPCILYRYKIKDLDVEEDNIWVKSKDFHVAAEKAAMLEIDNSGGELYRTFQGGVDVEVSNGGEFRKIRVIGDWIFNLYTEEN